MAAATAPLLPSRICFPLDPSCSHSQFQSPNLNPSFPLRRRSNHTHSLTLTLVSSAHTLTPPEPPPPPTSTTVPHTLLRFAASAALLLGIGLGCCCVASARSSPLPALQDQATDDDNLEAAFGTWKSKTFALTVPLTVAALRGSVPPSWIKDFMQSQGKRSKLQLKSHASLESVISDLSRDFDFSKGDVRPSSVAAADVVSIGDSWLSHAINKGLIEPIQGVEDQDWYRGLSDRWKEL